MNLKSVLLVSALSVAAAANAQSLAVFNFNDAVNASNGTPSSANTTQLFDVDRVATNVVAADTFITSTFAAANVTNFNGTTVNANGGDVAGQALALVSGGTGSTASGNFVSANNGKYFQIKISAASGFDLDLSSVVFAIQRTSTGFTDEAFSYSLDGSTFASLSTANAFQASFATPATGNPTTIGLTAIPNAPTVYIRSTLTGATSTAGNNRIDNLLVNGSVVPQAVPEPATIAAFGLGVAAMVRRRRKA